MCIKLYRVSMLRLLHNNYAISVILTAARLSCSKIVGDQSIVGDYTRVRIFLDENFDSLEKFTALGSLYLLHDSVKDVELYNFKTLRYDKVEG